MAQSSRRAASLASARCDRILAAPLESSQREGILTHGTSENKTWTDDLPFFPRGILPELLLVDASGSHGVGGPGQQSLGEALVVEPDLEHG